MVGSAFPGVAGPQAVPQVAVPRPKSTLAWAALGMAAISTIAIGVGSWAILASIQIDATPFSAAKWWFVALVVASFVPLGAVILSIFALVRKGNAVAAVCALVLGLVGPAAASMAGVTVGMDSFLNHLASAAQGQSGSMEDALMDSDLPPWAKELVQEISDYDWQRPVSRGW
jgi:hypothetical protein